MVRYTCDAVGNPQTKTGARNVTTTYSYDALNRLVRKSYSNGTSAVTFQFDKKPDGSSLAYALGRLVQVSNGASATNITGYDPIGEITGSQQITGGQAYNFAYDYNFSGVLISQTYPSGRVVTSSYDGGNRPAYVQGSWAGAATNYVGNPNDPNFWTQLLAAWRDPLLCAGQQLFSSLRSPDIFGESPVIRRRPGRAPSSSRAPPFYCVPNDVPRGKPNHP